PDLQRLAVRFRPEELVELVRVDAHHPEFVRVVGADELPEVGLGSGATSVLVVLVCGVQVRQSLNVRGVHRGHDLGRPVPIAPGEPDGEPDRGEAGQSRAHGCSVSWGGEWPLAHSRTPSGQYAFSLMTQPSARPPRW